MRVRPPFVDAEREEEARSMAVSRVSDRIRPSQGRGPAPGRLARWAVRLSVVFGLAFAVSVATIVIAYAAGSEGAVEDTWLGGLAAIIGSVGFVGSLAAFLLAIIARRRRDSSTVLWLPLCAFPAFLLFLVLGEAFWWE
jgi:uncharacterized membrane protein YhaH (DUF805 family)